MQRQISTEIKKSPKTSTNYPTTHGSSNFDAACVQPPCVPMVHSRHPHHAWSVIGARNTSSRAPQDQMILWLKHFWAPWLLHKAFPPISCSAKTSFSDRILEAEAKPQSINYKAAVRHPQELFSNLQDGAVPAKVIGYVWLQLCHLSMGTGTGTIRSTTSLVPAQYFSAKKAATPARIQTWSQARHGEAVLIQCGFLPDLWTAYSCFFSHVAAFLCRFVYLTHVRSKF